MSVCRVYVANQQDAGVREGTLYARLLHLASSYMRNKAINVSQAGALWGCAAEDGAVESTDARHGVATAQPDFKVVLKVLRGREGRQRQLEQYPAAIHRARRGVKVQLLAQLHKDLIAQTRVLQALKTAQTKKAQRSDVNYMVALEGRSRKAARLSQLTSCSSSWALRSGVGTSRSPMKPVMQRNTLMACRLAFESLTRIKDVCSVSRVKRSMLDLSPLSATP